MKIKLIGGPCDGMEIEAQGSGAIVIEGDLPGGVKLGEDEVVRYKRTRKRDEYRFDCYDHVVARLPLPGSDRGIAVTS